MLYRLATASPFFRYVGNWDSEIIVYYETQNNIFSKHATATFLTILTHQGDIRQVNLIRTRRALGSSGQRPQRPKLD